MFQEQAYVPGSRMFMSSVAAGHPQSALSFGFLLTSQELPFLFWFHKWPWTC